MPLAYSKLGRYCPFVGIKAKGLGQSASFLFLLFSLFDLVRKQSRTRLVGQFARQCFAHSANVWDVEPGRKSRDAFHMTTPSQRRRIEIAEKRRMGIRSAEKINKNCTPQLYSKRVGFGRHFWEGLWMKFNTKCGYLRGPVYRIVNTSHREKEIFNTRYKMFFEFKSLMRLIAFHIALIPLGKVWIQLFSLQLWMNSRADWLLQLWRGN